MLDQYQSLYELLKTLFIHHVQPAITNNDLPSLPSMICIISHQTAMISYQQSLSSINLIDDSVPVY